MPDLETTKSQPNIKTEDKRAAAIRLSFQALGKVYGNSPWPVEAVRLVRRIGNKPDVLMPKKSACLAPGAGLRNRFLSDFFKEKELGQFSLSVQTIDFMEDKIKSAKPHLILEFGSGISTVCLARFMSEVHGDSEGDRVLSIDQDPDYAEQTRELLKRAGLEKKVKILVAPLSMQTIDGVEARCYSLDNAGPFFTGRKADFVFIDGPYDRNSPSRYGTLPQVREFVKKQATFFLDDAFRDKELLIAALWKKLPYIKLLGIHPVAKGLLEGRIL